MKTQMRHKIWRRGYGNRPFKMYPGFVHLALRVQLPWYEKITFTKLLQLLSTIGRRLLRPPLERLQLLFETYYFKL